MRRAPFAASLVELLSGLAPGLQFLIAASALLFGFVVARMALARQRSVDRARTLAGAASALAAAATREQVGRAAAAAARKLAGETASVLVVSGATAHGSASNWPLPPAAARALRDAAGAAVVTLEEATCLALHLPLGRRRALVHAFAGGFLVVAGSPVDRPGVRRALRGLGVQIGFALERRDLPRRRLQADPRDQRTPVRVPDRACDDFSRPV
jgi:K+-sensing histidine kinase KdpD